VRLRHLALYGVTCAALLAPYAVFVQLNGGVATYVRQVVSWAARERARTPIEWPGLFDNPAGVSAAAQAGGPWTRTVATLQDNIVAWTYYAELLLPLAGLGLLALSRNGFRPGWPLAREKLVMVAVLAVILDIGFLRSPLESRLADPSVPIAILIAWLAVALPRAVFTSAWIPARVHAYGWVLRAGGVVLACGLGALLWALLSQDFHRRMERAFVTEGLDAALERSEVVAGQVRSAWQLDSWVDRQDRPGPLTLALYLNACTAPTDRVFVQAYVPQVPAMARRAFAGGHADLRPGFFITEDAQRLTVERLRRQSVPIVLLETGEAYTNFRSSFPIVNAYLDREYVVAGVRAFDERFGTTLLVRRDRTPGGTDPWLGWPCFGPGEVQP
jgi:hypothetical protein